MLRRFLMLISIASVVCPTLVEAADSTPLSGSVEAVKVVRTDDGNEVFVPADKASPDDIIEYRLTWANNGPESLQNVVVTDPVPSGTAYVDRSATRPSQGTVEFSADGGKTFHAWPFKVVQPRSDGSVERVDATPDMVTHIRWTVGDAFDPDTEFTFSYRTIVK